MKKFSLNSSFKSNSKKSDEFNEKTSESSEKPNIFDGGDSDEINDNHAPSATEDRFPSAPDYGNFGARAMLGILSSHTAAAEKIRRKGGKK